MRRTTYKQRAFIVSSEHDRRVARLNSEIAHLEARYDSGGMPHGIYAVLIQLKRERDHAERASRPTGENAA